MTLHTNFIVTEFLKLKFQLLVQMQRKKHENVRYWQNVSVESLGCPRVATPECLPCVLRLRLAIPCVSLRGLLPGSLHSLQQGLSFSVEIQAAPQLVLQLSLAA